MKYDIQSKLSKKTRIVVIYSPDQAELDRVTEAIVTALDKVTEI